MEIKERHYRMIPELVRRDRSDAGTNHLDSRLTDTLHAQALLESVPTVSPEHPNLIPTADGAFTRILFTIPSYAVEDPTMSAAYESLLSKLPAGVRLVVLAQDSCLDGVKKWLTKYGLEKNTEISGFQDLLNISIWAEDGYVVITDKASKSTYFVEPYAFPRYADSLIADYVGNFTNLKDTRAPLYFQGGNVLIGDQFFFIGADYPANSLKYISSHVLKPPEGQDPKAFIRSLYREFLDRDREVFYVGSTATVPTEQKRKTVINGETWTETVCAGNAVGTVQPLFHIDMFITLVGQANGKYRLLVGDPSAAYQILGGVPPPHAMQNVFDNIADQLSANKFDVVRNPLPLVYMDDPGAKERVWYFATANNALVQNAPQPKVWLPTYGYGAWRDLSKTDAANADLWRKLGFSVELLGDFHPFAENLGAVHCIKKYLARTV